MRQERWALALARRHAGWGLSGTPSSCGERGQTLPGHHPKGRGRIPAGCWAVLGAGWSWGGCVCSIRAPSAHPRVLQYLPVLVTCCHLVPPRHKCWGPGVLKVGVPRVPLHPWGPHPRQPCPKTAPLVLQGTTFIWFSKQASDLSPAYGVKARTPNISQPPGHH